MHIDNPGVSRRYYDLVNEYKQADFFFLSFPKCGRTWVRYTLGTYFHLAFGVHKTHKLNSTHVGRMIERRNQGCPLISFTHDYFSLGDRITKIEFQKIESNIKDFVKHANLIITLQEELRSEKIREGLAQKKKNYGRIHKEGKKGNYRKTDKDEVVLHHRRSGMTLQQIADKEHMSVGRVRNIIKCRCNP